jgi:hypothetical protein
LHRLYFGAVSRETPIYTLRAKLHFGSGGLIAKSIY